MSSRLALIILSGHLGPTRIPILLPASCAQAAFIFMSPPPPSMVTIVEKIRFAKKKPVSESKRSRTKTDRARYWIQTHLSNSRGPHRYTSDCSIMCNVKSSSKLVVAIVESSASIHCSIDLKTIRSRSSISSIRLLTVRLSMSSCQETSVFEPRTANEQPSRRCARCRWAVQVVA